MTQSLESIAKHLNLLRDMEDVNYLNIRRKHSDILSEEINGIFRDQVYNFSQFLYIRKNIIRGLVTGAIAGAIAYNLNDLDFKENIVIGASLGMILDFNQAFCRHIYDYLNVQTSSLEED